MRKFLLNVLTALSLLLCVATCAVWVRSYSLSQFVGWSNCGWYGALSMRGLVRLEHGNYPGMNPGWSYIAYPTPGAGGLWQEARARDRYGWRLRAIGIAYARIDYAGNGGQVRRALYLPHWLLAAATVAAPAWRLWQIVRARRRTAVGFCPRCGYDLRATPERCPECGAGRGCTT